MAQYPAMPLWTDAYLGDTFDLSTLEHGAYLLLLMTMWRSGGSLPDDDKKLARSARLTTGQWKRIKPRLMEFFKVENGVITQGRLTDEYNAVRQKSKRQSEKAKSRWLKTKETHDAAASAGHSQSNASLTLTHNHIESSIEDSCFALSHENDQPEDCSESQVEEKPKPPPDLFPEFWNAYPHRNGAKKGKTLARKRWDKAVKSGADPGEIIQGARAYHRDRQVVDGYAPDPATWLNQARWSDEIEPMSGEKMNGYESDPNFQAAFQKMKAAPELTEHQSKVAAFAISKGWLSARDAANEARKGADTSASLTAVVSEAKRQGTYTELSK